MPDDGFVGEEFELDGGLLLVGGVPAGLLSLGDGPVLVGLEAAALVESDVAVFVSDGTLVC